ncbi:hypothetical protein Glove_212g141 [Diversispora epigaea]|uniref:Protein kinase domain-containing protein n=1 Tax=Diversispora epigaea TaxID=1348612 RepID=A0A397ILE2_9GLOM|nr:hypothetical protein Glove_212g141 [Diversispora epigaea]
MCQKISKTKYCPAGHSSRDFAYSGRQNHIYSGICDLCTKERFIQELKTCSSGNANIDKILQESQINIPYYNLQWMPYDNFQNINHKVDSSRGSVYSAELKNGRKECWNFLKQEWEYELIGHKVALKEITDSRYDIAGFLKMKSIYNHKGYVVEYYGFSKNPSTQNYIFVMELFDDDLHGYLNWTYLDLKWG